MTTLRRHCEERSNPEYYNYMEWIASCLAMTKWNGLLRASQCRKEKDFKMKLIHIILMLGLLFIFTLNAQSPAKSDYLTSNLFNTITQLNLPDSSSYYINLQTRDTDELNLFSLQQSFLEKNKIVVDTEQFADYSISIRVEEKLYPKKKGRFPAKEELWVETIFIVQIVQLSDARVLDVNRFTIDERYQDQQQVTDKWYTPFLIVFVLGSLVYLLYYGGS